MAMRIFLWGFMGAGKTFLGKALADVLQMPFYDLDAEIESVTQKSVADLFAELGEAYFRELETQTLHTFETKPAFVMACGGGTPCYADNASWMKKHGITVWINPPVELLVKRLKSEKQHRPLLAQVPDEQLEEVIRHKLAQRSIYYSQAHLTIEAKCTPVARLKNQLQHLADLLTSYNHYL
jgi:shikimate kinase